MRWLTSKTMHTSTLLWFCAGALSGLAQVTAPPAPSQPPPLTLTLKDALERAQMNAPQLLAAIGDASSAHEDLLLARGARRPSLSARSEYLGTQGNGVLSESRFVTNDGVHVYRDWAVVHQDFTAGLFRGTGLDRTSSAEALARAKSELALRDMATTVT